MLKPNRIKQTLFLFLIFSVLFVSCLEKDLDFDNIRGNRWAAHWAVPLVNSSLIIDDFLNDSSNTIGESEDGLLKLVYESDELVSIQADEIAEIPDQEKIEQKNVDIPDVPPGINDSIAVAFDFTFQLDEEGLRIDSILLKNGFFHFTTRTDIDRDVSSIGFTIPNFLHLETNSPMHFEIDISNNISGIIVRDTLIDMSLYKLHFDHAFSDTNVVSIEAMVKFVGDDNQNNSPYFIEIENSFSQMEFMQFYGYMGQQVVHIDDTVSIDIFNIDQVGNFQFGDGSVDLTIDVNNSFGLPVRMEVATFKAYTTGESPDSVDIYLFGEGNPAEFDISSPEIWQIGETVSTQIVSDNSNMNEALAISPTELYIDINAHLNPDAIPDVTNFILDSSLINAKITMDLELYGSINGFEVLDTVEFNLKNASEFESLYFVAEIENGFPVTILLTLEFVDSLYNPVYTLFPEGESIIVAAGVGSPPDYRVISPTTELTEIDLPKEDLEILEDARQILVTATLSTEEGQEVKIYADYEILLRLGAKVGIYY